jgi:hypothetical protein
MPGARTETMLLVDFEPRRSFRSPGIATLNRYSSEDIINGITHVNITVLSSHAHFCRPTFEVEALQRAAYRAKG